MNSENNQCIQYGCGLCAPPGWRNFDASPTLRLQRLPLLGYYFKQEPWPIFPANVEYGDIVKGLPVVAHSCKAIYCSHILEHLALEDVRIALQHTYSYLEMGGTFRFVLPDLERLARDYLVSTETNASIQFMEQAHLGKKQRPRGMKEFIREFIGNSQHLWMWDFKALTCELEHVGFQNIRRAEFGDSSISRFTEVEDYGRWKDCLGVECIK